jgi:hypothetical protein
MAYINADEIDIFLRAHIRKFWRSLDPEVFAEQQNRLNYSLYANHVGVDVDHVLRVCSRIDEIPHHKIIDDMGLKIVSKQQEVRESTIKTIRQYSVRNDEKKSADFDDWRSRNGVI